MLLRCPLHQKITKLEFARWQRIGGTAAPPTGPDGWHCYGEQPPPTNVCESDVTPKLAPLCVGLNSCDLSNHTDEASLGQPCATVQALPGRLSARHVFRSESVLY
jgi:hypothetical protein